MTIEITSPQVEMLINERLQRSRFKDAEDVILQALQSGMPDIEVAQAKPTAEAKDLVKIFAPLRGLNLTFERDRDTGRDIKL